MTRRWFHSSHVLLLSVVPLSAYAQPQTAALFWEFSSDNGATWTAHALDVAPHTTLLARVMVAWERPDPFSYFGGATFDAFVARDGAHGDSDMITNVLTRWRVEIGLYSRETVQVFDLPSVLKIDDFRDTQPPGQGPQWLSVSQSPNFDHSFADPISVLQFDYHIDSSAGVRRFDAAFFSGNIQLWFPGTHGEVWAPVLSQSGTVVVVPIPSISVVVAAAATVAIARRRRRCEECS